MVVFAGRYPHELLRQEDGVHGQGRSESHTERYVDKGS
jgi:hypothetical protein